jgi:hypothetical protein
MLQSGKDLKDITVVELKALAYDILVGIEQGQKNLQMVNQMIKDKASENLGVKLGTTQEK